jgi:hypothetical protein
VTIAEHQKMEKCYQDQLERIYRLMEIIDAKDPQPLIGRLRFEDVLIFVCQCMWHLKDWVLNDSEFGARDLKQLNADIHSEKCLLICADLANGSKHLVLSHPKTGFDFAERTGVRVDTEQGIFQQFYYVISTDPTDPYHRMEIRDLLAECMDAWNRIIDKHWLSGMEF